jgi:geranyl-CoA carboxylase alpha subunit
LHTQLADTAVFIGAAQASESYLNAGKILGAAQRTEADAVHPGYGFLAENADFAQACADAGLKFIGPSPEAIRLMGSKRQSKLRMAEASVPVIPGYSGAEQSPEALITAAEEIGFPLMVKASAGGGGRGLRLVNESAQLPGALNAARAEAESAFGDGELILEKAVMSARHVEIQVFADQQGHVIHLAERDCSVQRRHQKVLEEAPSPAVNPQLRAKMGAAAVAAAQAINYEGAGTVEMLLADDGQFYFMEMNTRLQVEHPVTELVTGQDLVAWQLDIAAGRPLPITQEELQLDGHAIEARLYAEDAHSGFLPQTGTICGLTWPQAVRVDHGLHEGQVLTTDYDAMLAKVVAHGRDRKEALARLKRALGQLRVQGLVTNQSYLLSLLQHPEFERGQARTDFIERHMKEVPVPAPSAEYWALAAVLCIQGHGSDYWRSGGLSEIPVRLGFGTQDYRMIVREKDGRFSVSHEDHEIEVRLHCTHAEIDGRLIKFDCEPSNDAVVVHTGAHRYHFDIRAHSDAAKKTVSEDVVLAPMAGKVIAVHAASGQAVQEGDILVVLEAMKMQMELTASRAGEVEAVHVKPGMQVRAKQPLVQLVKEEQS